MNIVNFCNLLLFSLCASTIVFASTSDSTSVYASTSVQPSKNNCSYYQLAEEQLQCGNKSYMIGTAYPQCLYYLKISKFLNHEIQNWFPQIRYCLQNEIEQNLHSITCDNINDFALNSHVNCYVSLGYCELSFLSKLQLTLITLPKLNEKIWQDTAKAINDECLKQ